LTLNVAFKIMYLGPYCEISTCSSDNLLI
jgi:hypothetical protein